MSASAFASITKSAARSHHDATESEDGQAAMATSRRKTGTFWMVCVQCQLGGFRLGEEQAKTDLPTEFFVYKEWHTPRTLVGTGVDIGMVLHVHLPL